MPQENSPSVPPKSKKNKKSKGGGGAKPKNNDEPNVQIPHPEDDSLKEQQDHDQSASNLKVSDSAVCAIISNPGIGSNFKSLTENYCLTAPG